MGSQTSSCTRKDAEGFDRGDGETYWCSRGEIWEIGTCQFGGTEWERRCGCRSVQRGNGEYEQARRESSVSSDFFRSNPTPSEMLTKCRFSSYVEYAHAILLFSLLDYWYARCEQMGFPSFDKGNALRENCRFNRKDSRRSRRTSVSLPLWTFPLDSLAHNWLFHSTFWSTPEETYSVQTGVCRINCIDSLDVRAIPLLDLA